MAVLSELTPFSYQVLILIAVLLVKFIVNQFVVNDPLRFFQFYCLQLSNKVNKSANSNQQQAIAGLLSLLITLAPIGVILWLFADFLAVPYLWHAFLLYFALGNLNLGQESKGIRQALMANQKQVAKEALKPLVLRETNVLSTMGLSKATIEMQLLRSLQQIYVVAFVFIVVGPLAAILYRLILEMHYSWNPKLPQYTFFGYVSQLLSQIIQWVPSRLFGLFILLSSLGQGSWLMWRFTRSHFFKLDNNFVIAVQAFSLGIKLGGVALYQDIKLRKVAFNDLGKQPAPLNLLKANGKINFVIIVSLFLLISLAITHWFATSYS